MRFLDIRLFGDVRALGRNLAELRELDASEEEKASYDMALSAYKFSRETREAVDDKLSFSATLMRAGEVQAATRLIQELEEEVHSEEIALVEAIEELHTAQTERRGKITRLRLARLLVTAVFGAAVMGASAAGMTVAGMFSDKGASAGAVRVAIAPSQPGRGYGAKVASLGWNGKGKKKVMLGDIVVALDKAQLVAYRDIKNGVADGQTLIEFLNSLPSGLIDTVREAIIASGIPVDDVVAETVEATSATSYEASKPSSSKTQTDEQSDNEPNPEPSGGNGDSGDDGDSIDTGVDTKDFPF